MKKTIVTGFLVLFVSSIGWTQQKFLLKINDGDEIEVTNVKNKFTTKQKASKLDLRTGTNDGKTYSLNQDKEDGTSISQTFAGDGAMHSFDLAALGFLPIGRFAIEEGGAEKRFFIISPPKKIKPKQANQPTTILPKEDIGTFISNQYKLKTTRLGLVATNATNSKNTGNDITHIFVDQYGNNIFSTIPQGVPERQYVVHAIYMAEVGNRNLIYAINESKSGFNPQLSVANTDIRSLIAAGNLQLTNKDDEDEDEEEEPQLKVTHYQWIDQEIVLSTSTDDIEFELYRVLVNKDTVYNFDKLKLGTFTIKMSPRYHVSMDVGLVRSNLKNPDYQLVQSPDNANEKVVKEGVGGNRGVVTLMATFYTSPVLLWKKYVAKKHVPAYKLTGRNYLDDHSLFERIYPAIGVGFTDKTLENLFVGVNWEIVRGGAFFIGVHYGKVNTFDKDKKLGDAFEFSKTAVTEEQFSLYKDQNWKTGLSFGAKVDVKIITSLFAPASNNSN